MSKAANKSEGYFQAQLARAATADHVAAPATPESFKTKLDAYLDESQVKRVMAAYDYAFRKHRGQMRRTGHPYITHPLAVADTLADWRMDHQTLIAALLHDVIEDTGVAKKTLGDRFGKEVSEIVDGVSKLTTIFHSRDQAQAENFQKMAMAMAKDIRVILVKLADRLHNMRTIGVMSREQRKRIARETLDYYAPIAHRLGMHNLRVEFEDLGFQAYYPLRADRIGRALLAIRGNRKELIDELRTSIETALRREGIDAGVTGREKHLYSIYKKMKTQHKSFSDIMDVYGFRIVVDRVDTCYRVLGVVHNLYNPVPNRFKDYVAIPKSNGYQSLHTTLFGMHGVPIEVQIRTKQMDALADHGIAGHWLYKSDLGEVQGSQVRAREWVRGLLDLQQRAGDSIEFIESLKIDLFPDAVYLFTPKGEIFELPSGVCSVDFAYAIHTDVGNACVACRVDRALAPLSQRLESGQTVQIITSDDARPNPDWLSFVVTGKARTGIRHALKHQQKSASIALGRRLLNRSLGNANATISDFDFRKLRKVFKDFGVRNRDEVLEAIGTGNLMAYVVAQRLLSIDNPEYEAIDVDQGGPVAVRGGEGLVITYSKCCGPVPGDPIAGHMTRGKGFVIHIETCRNIQEVRRRKPSEIIPARWSDQTESEFLTTLRVEVRRQKGVIAELAAVATDLDAGIDDIHIKERSAAQSSAVMQLSVRDRTHVARIMRRLRVIPAVHSINRVIA